MRQTLSRDGMKFLGTAAGAAYVPVMDDLLSYPIERRIRAAMELAGVESVAELARRIDTRGLGARTLRKFQDPNDPREPRPHELSAIAKALDLPDGLLSLDERTDTETINARVARLEATIQEVLSRLPATDAREEIELELDGADEQDRSLSGDSDAADGSQDHLESGG
jgi:hypothetical protein